MTKTTLFVAVILLFLPLLSQTARAQAPSRVTIKGVVRDTANAEIPYATVMLLNTKDSTLANFTRSDEKGAFSFKNVRNQPYIFKISYVAFIPYQQLLEVSPSETNDLGVVIIKPISQAIMEVVVRTAKAPLSIRGDTIEYDATTFKVPPGSTVEDLLRRLPGIEVDADGNIRAQGQEVKRVYVDGKMFFGDDPKSATKNLGAETISKVQVYNDQSEQAKLTGVADGKKEKALNLQLKDEYKKGAFGKVSAAVGTDERWAARGNYNRFNTKEQLSFIAYGNNINQTGVNWEDYGEFKGQNSFNDSDNGDFGFENGRRYYYFDDEDTPINNFDGRGFTENYGGGVNYNYDHKKTKLNLSYFHNQSDLMLDQFGFRQTFLEENTFSNFDTSAQNDFRASHSFNTRLEQNIDSSDLFILKGNLRFSNSIRGADQSQYFLAADESPNNRLRFDNTNELNAWRINSALIYRHKFKKKGRSFAFSAGYNNSHSDGNDQLFSENLSYLPNIPTVITQQRNDNQNYTEQFKSSVLFTEALSKKWFLESFYNFSKTENDVNRQVTDPRLNNERVDTLSVFYNNDVTYNRLGTGLRYSHNALNFSFGAAIQQIRLQGAYSVDKNMPLLTDPIDLAFLNIVPNIDMSYEFENNLWFNLGYNYGVEEPRLNDLQPAPNVNNPAFVSVGNPQLTPSKSHNVNYYIGYWNPASFSSVGLGGGMNAFDNQIVYSQSVEFIDSIGIRTTTKPINLDGGYNFYSFIWSNFPIVKTKLTMNLNGNLNIGKSPAFVNAVRNETNNQNLSGEIGLTFTPSPKLILNAEFGATFNDIEYSIQQDQNQKIRRQGVESSIKWQFADKFFVESNFNYSNFKNDRFGFNQSIPIWNASVRRILGKNNRLEMRFACFDLLNKRVSISQYASQNYVTRNIANTLARYFMQSVSYNVRGYENKLKKNDWW